MPAKKRTPKEINEEITRLEAIRAGHLKTINKLKTDKKILDLEQMVAQLSKKK